MQDPTCISYCVANFCFRMTPKFWQQKCHSRQPTFENCAISGMNHALDAANMASMSTGMKPQLQLPTANEAALVRPSNLSSVAGGVAGVKLLWEARNQYVRTRRLYRR